MKEEKPIPRMRTNRSDINRIFGLYAGLQELELASREMEKRFRSIPNGWRDLKCIIAQFNKLMDNVMMTVPLEKLISIQRMLPKMQFKVYSGAQASDYGGDECLISLHEMDVMCWHAHEQCKLCIDQNCNQCELGKVLDSVMTYDRDGRSWANVSFRAIAD